MRRARPTLASVQERGNDEERLATLKKLELTQPSGHRQLGATSGDCSDRTDIGDISSASSRESLMSASWSSLAEADAEGVAYLHIPFDTQRHRSFLGCVRHEAGECRPCRFVFSAHGCRGGVKCDFCHLQHERTDSRRKRSCQGKRERRSLQDCQSTGAIEPVSAPDLRASATAEAKLRFREAKLRLRPEHLADQVNFARIPPVQMPRLEQQADAMAAFHRGAQGEPSKEILCVKPDPSCRVSL